MIGAGQFATKLANLLQDFKWFCQRRRFIGHLCGWANGVLTEFDRDRGITDFMFRSFAWPSALNSTADN